MVTQAEREKIYPMLEKAFSQVNLKMHPQRQVDQLTCRPIGLLVSAALTLAFVPKRLL